MAEIENPLQEVEKLLSLQSILDEREKAIQAENPGIFAQIKEINDQKAAVDNAWDTLKQRLIDLQDFDVHEATVGNYKCRLSVSKTVKIGVSDIDKVPSEFVETKKVADESKLKKYYELYGEIPDGCVDKSFYRLNKKISEVSNE